MNEVARQPDLFTVDQQIEQHAQNVEGIQRDAIFAIGRELAGAQELFRYKGEGFVSWLATRLPHIPQSSAYQAIDIYKGIDSRMFPNFGNMKPGALAEVAKAEPDLQAEIAMRVEAGEIFTAAAVKQLREDAARDALAAHEEEAKEIREKLAKAKKALAERDEANADLEDQIAALSATLADHEKRIAEVAESLPTPKEARAQAAADPDAGVVLGRDGKFHAGLSPEAEALSADYLTVWTLLEALTTAPSPARVAMGCDPAGIAELVRFCDQASQYIAQLREAANAKAP